MTAMDPRGQQPTGPKLSASLATAVLLALAVGGLLQEVRWRGGFGAVAPSPIESGEQQLKLGELAFRNGNDQFALKLFDRLATKHDAVAEYWVAHMTELGLGVPKNIPKAISLYEKAADQNSVAAQSRLGEIYLNGNLVPPDYAKAFDLLGKAALHGNPRAAMLIGQMYRFGLATKADPIESYAWSEVAVIEGLTFAKVEREAAFTTMSPSDRQKAAARSAVLLNEIKAATSATTKS